MTGNKEKIAAAVDLPSLVDAYIVQEFGKNRDVGFASFFFYKKAGGKFYFTSPWDFDLAWGNDENYPTTDGLVSDGTNGNQWFGVLAKQAWFCEMVSARMQELTDRVEALGKELLAVGKALTYHALQDEVRWDTLNKKVFLEPSAVPKLPDYEAHYQYFYNWYMARWSWLCDYFGVK
jgi:spore coat protein CotH